MVYVKKTEEIIYDTKIESLVWNGRSNIIIYLETLTK